MSDHWAKFTTFEEFADDCNLRSRMEMAKSEWERAEMVYWLVTFIMQNAYNLIEIPDEFMKRVQLYRVMSERLRESAKKTASYKEKPPTKSRYRPLKGGHI